MAPLLHMAAIITL